MYKNKHFVQESVREELQGEVLKDRGKKSYEKRGILNNANMYSRDCSRCADAWKTTRTCRLSQCGSYSPADATRRMVALTSQMLEIIVETPMT